MKFLINKKVLSSWSDDKERICAFREVWKKKRVLRKIYYDKWEQMLAFSKPGKILEIGSGPGFFRNYCRRSILLDIVSTPWIDVTGSGTALPFKNESFSNVVFVDVFHHVYNAIEYMQEMERILKKGGRLIFEEPYVSPISYPIYKIHHEDLNMHIHSNGYRQKADKKPLDANLATPTLMFCKHFREIGKFFPRLKLIYLRKQDCFFHCLYGNFTYKQLIPTFMYHPLRLLEKALGPLRNLLAFKVLIVLEKE